MTISPADLPLNPDGSVYHLSLLPSEISDTIILVGDPRRAIQIAGRFDDIETKKQKRELITYTGLLNKKRLTVIGTGMGIDNIDIVMNELDALANVDLKKREVKKNLTSLDIIRLGTAGGIQESTEIGSFVISDIALGFDNLLDFYDYPYTPKEQAVLDSAKSHFRDFQVAKSIYVAEGDADLIAEFDDFTKIGFTLTSTGFYGPQHRKVRAPLIKHDLLKYAKEFSFEGEQILNMEMETSAIYGLGRLLGHRCCSISAIVANRITKEFCTDSLDMINKLIDKALERIA